MDRASFGPQTCCQSSKIKISRDSLTHSPFGHHRLGGPPASLLLRLDLRLLLILLPALSGSCVFLLLLPTHPKSVDVFSICFEFRHPAPCCHYPWCAECCCRGLVWWQQRQQQSVGLYEFSTRELRISTAQHLNCCTHTDATQPQLKRQLGKASLKRRDSQLHLVEHSGSWKMGFPHLNN